MGTGAFVFILTLGPNELASLGKPLGASPDELYAGRIGVPLVGMATDRRGFRLISHCWYLIGLPRPRRVTEDWGLIPEREPERWLPLLRKAAGAQITHCQSGEVVTTNNDVDSR